MLQIVKTESSLARWRKRVRGTLAIKQLETCHILSKGRISLPERSRQYFPGTNCGDTLTNVDVPPPEDVWRLTWKNKKQLYGKKHLIAVGGKTDGVDTHDHVKRTDDTMEPVVFHPMPLTFYFQVLEDFYAKRVIDLVAGDAFFAYACLLRRVGYVGICFTQYHADALHAHLISKLRVDMADPANALYNPSYALAIGANSADPADPQHPPGGAPPKPKPKPKATGKPKPKATTKKTTSITDDKDDVDNESDAFSGEGCDGDDVWDPLEDGN